MMTVARFDEDGACFVIDVLGNPLQFQVRFSAEQLVEADDEVLVRAAHAWRRWQLDRALTSADLVLLHQAQIRLANLVRDASW